MTPTIAQSILLAVAVLAVLFLVHRFAPTSAVGKAEGQLLAEAEKVVPSVEAVGMQALTAAEMWITDTHSKDAAIAKLQAEKAAIIAAARAHVAKVLAVLPPEA